jgi:long-chain acyl-CoA synthetase
VTSITDTIPARLIQQASLHGDRPAYFVREGEGQWTSTNYRTYAAQVTQAAQAMVTLGLEPGQSICILSFNRPEWVIADLACMMIGGVPAGIYETCSPEEVAYIISHSEAPIVIIEDPAQWEKINAERKNLPNLRTVVLLDGADTIDDPLIISWADFMAKSEETAEAIVDERLAALEGDACGTYIYTSGTTGPPKAVMLSHDNLAWTALAARELVTLDGTDCSLSYLPLSHIAEQMFSIHAPISVGSHIYFASGSDDVPANLQEVQPTVLFAVPRVWEKFYAGVSSKLQGATGPKARLVDWAQRVGRAYHDQLNQSKTPGLGLSLKFKLANKLVYSKLKPKLGLGSARICVSGAAPIAPEILEFFAGFDVVIREVYGQSEDCGPTTFNIPGKTRFGSVGPVVPGVDVKIADDGEILVKGPNVFLGYFKDEKATNAALSDGWLYSGDLGSFDDQGFLSITGRKKEIIITAGGKNIAPKNLEAALKNLPLVSQAIVIGDRRKFLSALVTLEPEAAKTFAAQHSLDVDSLHGEGKLIETLQQGIDAEVNPRFARVEHIRKFCVLPRDLTVEDGELTPTLKIKRSVVNEHFSGEIENMYA